MTGEFFSLLLVWLMVGNRILRHRCTEQANPHDENLMNSFTVCTISVHAVGAFLLPSQSTLLPLMDTTLDTLRYRTVQSVHAQHTSMTPVRYFICDQLYRRPSPFPFAAAAILLHRHSYRRRHRAAELRRRAHHYHRHREHDFCSRTVQTSLLVMPHPHRWRHHHHRAASSPFTLHATSPSRRIHIRPRAVTPSPSSLRFNSTDTTVKQLHMALPPSISSPFTPALPLSDSHNRRRCAVQPRRRVLTRVVGLVVVFRPYCRYELQQSIGQPTLKPVCDKW